MSLVLLLCSFLRIIVYYRPLELKEFCARDNVIVLVLSVACQGVVLQVYVNYATASQLHCADSGRVELQRHVQLTHMSIQNTRDKQELALTSALHS